MSNLVRYESYKKPWRASQRAKAVVYAEGSCNGSDDGCNDLQDLFNG